MNAETQSLYQAACAARENSYSPYSNRKVGAAIRTSDGKIHSGCNVENSSYGATVCAERVAIGKAVSETGKIQIVEVMVVTDATPAWPPCGMCRQVIAEFGATAKIHFGNLKQEIQSTTLEALLPNAFTSKNLNS
jgi:cytidine deaminase